MKNIILMVVSVCLISGQALGQVQNNQDKKIEKLGDSDYTKHIDGIYFRDAPIVGADIPSFQIFEHKNDNDLYAKDRNHIYFNGEVVPEADVSSFQTLDIYRPFIQGYFAKDKNHIFVYGSINHDFDVKTFKTFDCGYITDDQKIYLIRKSFPLDQLDPQSFRVIHCDRTMIEYDPSRPYYRQYVRDKNGVYFFAFRAPHVLIKGADPDSFELVDPKNIKCRYAKDKHRVYRDEAPLNMRVDLDSFQCLQGTQYTQDKNHIFYMDKPVLGVDRETFKVVDINYSSDKNHMYYQNQRIKNVNPETFKVIQSPFTFTHGVGEVGKYLQYGKDQQHVYFRNTIVKGADPESFDLLVHPWLGEPTYAKDKNFIYLDGKRVKGADVNTFQVPKSK